MTSRSELHDLSITNTETFFINEKLNILDMVYTSINQAAVNRLTAVGSDISISNLDKIQRWYRQSIVDYIQRDKVKNGLSEQEVEEKYKGKTGYDFYDDLHKTLTKIYASHEDPAENLYIEIRDISTGGKYLYISWK